MGNERLMWLNNEIIQVEDAKINVLSPTSQFGANVFEGIRCYWNDDEEQLYAFRLDEHFKRLKNSMKMFRMEEKYSIEELTEAMIKTVKANNYKEDIAVRQTVFIDGFGSWMSKGPINMFIAPIPKQRRSTDEQQGLKCSISSWERISDRNMSPKVKVGANYINSRMAQMEALENGYDSAILLNNQGKISEGPGSSLFMIRNGKLITPPISASVLESITRETIIEIAKNELKLEVIERDIDRTELYICEEAFLCGSAMEVTSIASVDGIAISDGLLGKNTKTIHELYLEIASGNLEKYKEWLTPIYPE